MKLTIPDDILERLEWQTINPHSKELEQFPFVTNVLPKVEVCPHCSKTVEGCATLMRKYTVPEVHWRTQCKACKLWQNPDTNCFEFTSHEIQAFFRQKYAKRNK